MSSSKICLHNNTWKKRAESRSESANVLILVKSAPWVKTCRIKLGGDCTAPYRQCNAMNTGLGAPTQSSEVWLKGWTYLWPRSLKLPFQMANQWKCKRHQMRDCCCWSSVVSKQPAVELTANLRLSSPYLFLGPREPLRNPLIFRLPVPFLRKTNPDHLLYTTAL